MQLTAFTDYSLRVLIFLASQPEGKMSNIKEISTVYNISNNHLSKVVFELGKLGLVDTIRGRNGGIKLGKEPQEINIGWVVRQTEDNLNMAECFHQEDNHCIISPVCRLRGVLREALEAFLYVLDNYTLHDLIHNKNTLYEMFKTKT